MDKERIPLGGEQREMKTKETGLGWLFLPPLMLDSNAIREDTNSITIAGGVLFSNSIRRYVEC